jgi:hypothetical protein
MNIDNTRQNVDKKMDGMIMSRRENIPDNVFSPLTLVVSWPVYSAIFKKVNRGKCDRQ